MTIVNTAWIGDWTSSQSQTAQSEAFTACLNSIESTSH